jgi:hypothetical protein
MIFLLTYLEIDSWDIYYILILKGNEVNELTLIYTKPFDSLDQKFKQLSSNNQ